MAEAGNVKLTEEEMIAKKVKLRRTISYVLAAIAIVAIIVGIRFIWGAKQNVSQQTTIDTQELRSKLKMIIAIEKKYFEENGKYVSFSFLTTCKELPQYDPKVDGSYKYSFDAKTGVATGMEKDASSDVNNDVDGNDGLTLSVTGVAEVVKGNGGSNFFWPDEDLADFKTWTAPTAPAAGEQPK